MSGNHHPPMTVSFFSPYVPIDFQFFAVALTSALDRSPCPMLNALANHGYLPRDGKDISLACLVTALQDSINLAPDATLIAGVIALKASTTGNALAFHLSDLNKHGGNAHSHFLFSPRPSTPHTYPS